MSKERPAKVRPEWCRAGFTSARGGPRLPQASANLDQSASWAAQAGHIGHVFDTAHHHVVGLARRHAFGAHQKSEQADHLVRIRVGVRAEIRVGVRIRVRVGVGVRVGLEQTDHRATAAAVAVHVHAVPSVHMRLGEINRGAQVALARCGEVGRRRVQVVHACVGRGLLGLGLGLGLELGLGSGLGLGG